MQGTATGYILGWFAMYVSPTLCPMTPSHSLPLYRFSLDTLCFISHFLIFIQGRIPTRSTSCWLCWQTERPRELATSSSWVLTETTKWTRTTFSPWLYVRFDPKGESWRMWACRLCAKSRWCSCWMIRSMPIIVCLTDDGWGGEGVRGWGGEGVRGERQRVINAIGINAYFCCRSSTQTGSGAVR